MPGTVLYETAEAVATAHAEPSRAPQRADPGARRRPARRADPGQRRRPRARRSACAAAAPRSARATTSAGARRSWRSARRTGRGTRWPTCGSCRASSTSTWRSGARPSPSIAQVHGYCVGGGTDFALCSDLIVCAEDCRIGYPPARVWGSPTTAMWMYRLGLERSKRVLLTGDALDGRRAVEWGSPARACPPTSSTARRFALARRVALLPANQLHMMKVLVNQAFEQMGLHTTQLIGTLLDGASRHTPEGAAFSAGGEGRRAQGACASATPRSATTARGRGRCDGRRSGPSWRAARARAWAARRPRRCSPAGRCCPTRSPRCAPSLGEVAVVAKADTELPAVGVRRARSGASRRSRAIRSRASSRRCGGRRAGPCVVLACDLPFVTAELVRDARAAPTRRRPGGRRHDPRARPAAALRALRAAALELLGGFDPRAGDHAGAGAGAR